MPKRRKRRKAKKQIHAQNLVGPQIRKLRYALGLTQELFAARCSRVGWDMSRQALSKIEAAVRCVTDRELLMLARALKVDIQDLYPRSMHLPKRR